MVWILNDLYWLYDWWRFEFKLMCVVEVSRFFGKCKVFSYIISKFLVLFLYGFYKIKDRKCFFLILYLL